MTETPTLADNPAATEHDPWRVNDRPAVATAWPANGRDALIDAYDRAQDQVVQLRAAIAHYDIQAGYTQDPTTGPVSRHFGLTYAAYHVLHRTLMQSMPIEWQHRLVDCLEEMREAYTHIEHAEGYIVTPATETTYGDLTQEQAAAIGVTIVIGFDASTAGDTALVSVYHDTGGQIHQAWERVMVPAGDDPVPHYDRGRAYVPPVDAAQMIGAQP